MIRQTERQEETQLAKVQTKSERFIEMAGLKERERESSLGESVKRALVFPLSERR